MEQIVVTYKFVSLRKEDLNCIINNGYLTDRVIGFWYQIIQEKFPNQSIELIDPSVSMSIVLERNLKDIKECIIEPLNLKNKSFIFMPLNDNTSSDYGTKGNHWALNVIDMTNKTIYYFDSMLSEIDNSHVSHKKCEKLLGSKFAFKNALDEKIQYNSYDCGMFVLGITECLTNYLNEKEFNNNAFNDVNFDDLLNKYAHCKQGNMGKFRDEIYSKIQEIIVKKKNK